MAGAVSLEPRWGNNTKYQRTLQESIDCLKQKLLGCYLAWMQPNFGIICISCFNQGVRSLWIVTKLDRFLTSLQAFCQKFWILISFSWFEVQQFAFGWIWDHPLKTSTSSSKKLPMKGGRGQKPCKFANVLNGWSLC